MSTTQKQAVKAYSIFANLGTKVKGKAAFELFKLKLELEKVAVFQAEEEQKLIDKYGGVFQSDGKSITIENQENREAFLKERRELEELDSGIAPVTINISDVPDFTLDDIEPLYGFVNFV